MQPSSYSERPKESSVASATLKRCHAVPKKTSLSPVPCQKPDALLNDTHYNNRHLDARAKSLADQVELTIDCPVADAVSE